MGLLKRFVKTILGSKKASATVAGVLLGVAAPLARDKLGVDISQEQVLAVMGLLGTYVLGQGVADAGKERAKVESEKLRLENEEYRAKLHALQRGAQP